MAGLIALCGCILSGCDDPRQAPPADHDSATNAASGDEQDPSLTIDEARAIGNKYFKRQGGIYAEDTGDAFYIAPPIISRKDADYVAILVRKTDGEITPYHPKGHRERLDRYLRERGP